MGRRTAAVEPPEATQLDLFPEEIERSDASRDSGGSAQPGRNHATGWRGLLLWALQRATMLGLVGVMAATAAGVGALAAWLEAAPPITEVEDYRPPEATTVFDFAGRPVAALFDQRRTVVPLRELPRHLPDAFIAIEDASFRDHFGVDFRGVARAAVTNLMRRSAAQGASTITQQVPRNLIERIGRDKTLTRKVMETLVALQLEAAFAKDQILEVYLNHIYLGSGNYGVEAAAQAYFGKSAREVTVAEAALLAGLPQLPERYSPLNDADAAVRRRDQVLGRMYAVGYLNDAEFEDALREPLLVAGRPRGAGRAPYFIDLVRREVADLAGLGKNEVRTAGFAIRSTVDPAMQRAAEEAIEASLEVLERDFFPARAERFAEAVATPEFSRLPARGQTRMGRVVRVYKRSLVVELAGGWRADLPIPAATADYFTPEAGIDVGSGVDLVVSGLNEERRLFQGELLPRTRLQAAAVAIDNDTGEVRALVGGRSYFDAGNRGMFNRAVLARRQAGSTLKPLLFALGFERGITPDTTFQDEPVVFQDGYAPRNYEGQFFGPTTAQVAIEHSRNIPTIRLVQSIGLRTALTGLSRMQRYGSRRWHLPMEWPVVLGAVEMSPMELAAAWQPLGNGGRAMGPHVIAGVWNNQGREVPFSDERPDESLFSERATAWTLQMLAGVMTHGTGRTTRALLPADLRPRVVGKSGTTNDNRDAWFVGITPHETLVVWVGYDDGIELGPGRTGGKVAGPAWARVASALWALKSEEDRRRDLPMPAGWKLVPPAEELIAESAEEGPIRRMAVPLSGESGEAEAAPQLGMVFTPPAAP